MKIMNIMEIEGLQNIPLTQPIEPMVEADGWYAYCVRCENELDPHNGICPYCHQLQDWSWLGKYKKEEM